MSEIHLNIHITMKKIFILLFIFSNTVVFAQNPKAKIGFVNALQEKTPSSIKTTDIYFDLKISSIELLHVDSFKVNIKYDTTLFIKNKDSLFTINKDIPKITLKLKQMTIPKDVSSVVKITIAVSDNAKINVDGNNSTKIILKRNNTILGFEETKKTVQHSWKDSSEVILTMKTLDVGDIGKPQKVKLKFNYDSQWIKGKISDSISVDSVNQKFSFKFTLLKRQEVDNINNPDSTRILVSISDKKNNDSLKQDKVTLKLNYQKAIINFDKLEDVIIQEKEGRKTHSIKIKIDRNGLPKKYDNNEITFVIDEDRSQTTAALNTDYVLSESNARDAKFPFKKTIKLSDATEQFILLDIMGDNEIENTEKVVLKLDIEGDESKKYVELGNRKLYTLKIQDNAANLIEPFQGINQPSPNMVIAKIGMNSKVNLYAERTSDIICAMKCSKDESEKGRVKKSSEDKSEKGRPTKSETDSVGKVVNILEFEKFIKENKYKPKDEAKYEIIGEAFIDSVDVTFDHGVINNVTSHVSKITYKKGNIFSKDTMIISNRLFLNVYNSQLVPISSRHIPFRNSARISSYSNRRHYSSDNSLLFIKPSEYLPFTHIKNRYWIPDDTTVTLKNTNPHYYIGNNTNFGHYVDMRVYTDLPTLLSAIPKPNGIVQTEATARFITNTLGLRNRNIYLFNSLDIGFRYSRIEAPNRYYYYNKINLDSASIYRNNLDISYLGKDKNGKDSVFKTTIPFAKRNNYNQLLLNQTSYINIFTKVNLMRYYNKFSKVSLELNGGLSYSFVNGKLITDRQTLDKDNKPIFEKDGVTPVTTKDSSDFNLNLFGIAAELKYTIYKSENFGAEFSIQPMIQEVVNTQFNQKVYQINKKKDLGNPINDNASLFATGTKPTLDYLVDKGYLYSRKDWRWYWNSNFTLFYNPFHQQHGRLFIRLNVMYGRNAYLKLSKNANPIESDFYTQLQVGYKTVIKLGNTSK